MAFFRASSLIIFIVILFNLPSPAEPNSGSTGSITGHVVDAATQEPLIGANMQILDTTLGTVSNVDGSFNIDRIPNGTYALQVTMIGYKPIIQTDLVVTAVKPLELKVALHQTVLQGGNITVRPNYFEAISDKPLSVNTQSYSEIRRLPGGLEDVVRAISIMPGVAQVQNGRNDLIVRGGAPSENLYVVDGIEVPNINHFGTQGATGGPLSFINLDYIASTTFSSGGFGVRYGDKLSSVTSIELREGRKDQWGGKATISATQFGLNLEGPLKDKGTLVLSARRSYLDFVFKAAGFAFVPEYWDFLIKSEYALGQHDRLNLVAFSAIDDVKLFNDTAEKRYDNSRILASDQYQAVSGLSWKHLFGSGFSTVTLSNNRYRYNIEQADTLRNPVFGNQSLERETNLTANIVYKPAKWTELTFGLQGRMVLFNSEIRLPNYATGFGDSLNIDAALDTTAYKAAGWLQASQTLNRLTISAGLRLDYFNLIEKGFSLSPRMTLQYQLGNLTQLSVSAGRYYQSPAYVWIVAHPENRRLEPIAVDQYILGVQQLLRDDLKVTVEGYYKDYRNYPASALRPYLVMANTGAGFGGSEEGFASFGIDPLVSAGSGFARGVELFVQKRTSHIPHYGILSISYNQSQFKGIDGVLRPSSYDQRWIVNFGGGYIFNSRWEISGKFRLATGRPYTPYNIDLTKSAALYNSERIAVNHSLDIRVDRRWSVNSWELITYLDVQNVYNRPYRDVPRFNAYTEEFEDRASIGILPSIGVSLEF
ncbi:TonB-dependent receptor [candidate division KSB1 bacterium]|nr:TonB-dependent receptor [candidate division KSB1 bacterium]